MGPAGQIVRAAKDQVIFDLSGRQVRLGRREEGGRRRKAGNAHRGLFCRRAGGAQEFPETNMFETLAGQARQAFRLLIRSVEDSPWLFIALAVVTLVFLIRRHRF